jgi:glycosyltransferase involved in cell wall biosynthesis
LDKLREINLFSLGDAKKISAWSNVPYFFSKALEAKGITVNCVDIDESAFWNSLYKYSVFIFLKLISKDTRHTYFRSGFNNFITRRKIRQAEKIYTNAQANIFLTFSFSSVGLSKKPSILFGDWTYLYFIRNFLDREPKWFERNAVKREAGNINESQLVLALFPLSAAFIKTNYEQKNTHYLGNVINAVEEPQKGIILDHKLRFKKIVFIGNKKYLSGAKQLIEAFKYLNADETELHIIGLTPEETGGNSKNIYAHGYLDKGSETQRKKYYELLSQCALIVNTNEGWGAISAIIEAMYFYTMVITTPYKEFLETLATNEDEIDFGKFLSTDRTEDLAKLIRQLLENPPKIRLQLMENAHKAVKSFTWERYSENLVQKIEPLI